MQILETIKNLFKNRIFLYVVGGIIAGGMTVSAIYFSSAPMLKGDLNSIYIPVTPPQSPQPQQNPPSGIQLPQTPPAQPASICHGTPNPATIEYNANPVLEKVEVTWTVDSPNALYYDWDFGNGFKGTTQTSKMTYKTAGTKTASVKVTQGISDILYANCSVEVKPPVVPGNNLPNVQNVPGVVLKIAPKLTLSPPNPPSEYNPKNGSGFTVNYNLVKGSGTSIGITFKVYGPVGNSPKIVTIKDVKNTDGNYSLTWDGKVNGVEAVNGSYLYNIDASTAVAGTPLNSLPLQGSFTVKNTVQSDNVPDNTPNDNQGADNTPVNNDQNNNNQNIQNNQNNNVNNNVKNNNSVPKSQTPGNQTVTLKPAQDILSCALRNKTLVLPDKQKVVADCALLKNALVTAFVVSGTFNPNEAIKPEAIVKSFMIDKSKQAKPFMVAWNGIDNYDTEIPVGDYTMVVYARLDTTYTPDYSLQKFTVTDQPVVDETLHNAADEPVSPALEPEKVSAPEPIAEVPPEPSKCPGVNYPTDISGHWAEQLIKTAYDDCIVAGYADGKFYPDKSVSRAEAVKITLAGATQPPKAGCFDSDCGTTFADLDLWQGPWIRAAKDKEIVEGYTAKIFGPNLLMSRAEASALVARTFKIPAHTGCYTANCGAGYPTNLFIDINDFWQGPWIRALWDEGLVQGKAPYTFAPNSPITRAELVKIVIKAKELTPQ